MLLLQSSLAAVVLLLRHPLEGVVGSHSTDAATHIIMMDCDALAFMTRLEYFEHGRSNSRCIVVEHTQHAAIS